MNGKTAIDPAACKENARRYAIESIGEKWLDLFKNLTSKPKTIPILVNDKHNQLE